ncbi:MAG: amidohydrolase family protein, partial [Candidatus Methanospirareceae archaeon]
MSILIRRVLLRGKEVDIYIKGNVIERIGEDIKERAEFVIDGEGKAAIPGLFNSHTHAAMTLLRGYADDMPLQEWLQTKIWPIEAVLTKEEAYWGVKLACLEMIKSGTTFFNDMYWFLRSTVRAVEEMGLRAMLSAVFIDMFDEERAKEQMRSNERLFKEVRGGSPSGRISFSLGPHSIYTVSKESLC